MMENQAINGLNGFAQNHELNPAGVSLYTNGEVHYILYKGEEYSPINIESAISEHEQQKIK